MKKILSIIASMVLCVGLMPLPAFAAPSGGDLIMGAMADDTSYTVEAYADATNGDVTKAAGNVTPTRLINDDAYGVRARAEDDKTATVTVGDISVNLPSADFGYGVAAYAGYDLSTKTSGHTFVTTGNVTSYEYGIHAYATYTGDTTVVVNGNVQSGAFDGITGTGAYAGARDGARTSVTVNGNVSARANFANQSTGVYVDSPEYDNQRTATASITVNGDVTSSNGLGVLFHGAASTQDILVTGTVTGSTYGVVTDTYYGPATGTNKFTVWKIAPESGKTDDMFVKVISFKTYAVDDDSAKAANYIVKASKGVTPLAADGSALAESHGYPVAKEGERVLVTASNGNVVKKAYNNGVEITTKDDNGNFYLEVPRGGGIDLSAEIGDQPAPKTAKVPAGQALAYNGKEQTGVVGGVGFTLSGATSAAEVGSYKATATLAGGYTWEDGTTTVKEVGWEITHVDTSMFTDLDADAWYMGTENGAFAGTQTLYMDHTLATGLMSGYKGTTRFGPDDNMSRAMVATVIYRMANDDITPTTDPAKYEDNTSGLSDVADRQWYTAAVNWCVSKGIITGFTTGPNAGRFCPDDNTTREQLATITGRYCTKVAGLPSAGDDVSNFSDALAISGFAKEGVAFCVANKVVGGYTDGSGRFDPQGNATRCQGAKIFAVTARLVK